MKKGIFIGLTFLTIFANVSNAADYCKRSTNSSSSARYLRSVSFTGGSSSFGSVSIASAGNAPIYYDKTSYFLQAEAGAVITPQINYEGSWMQGYVYVDYNNDGVFNTDNELVSYSGFLDDNNVWKDSKGAVKAGGDNCRPADTPSFTIPSDLNDGDYRLRVNIDWTYKGACGRDSYTGNSMEQNGGAIVDFTLRIKDSQKRYEIDITDSFSSELVLDWTEEFDSGVLDKTVWTKISPYEGNNPDWRKNISTYDGCFEFRDGNIVLKGIKNPGQAVTGDTREYLCGGIESANKKDFMRGKVEVRAKYGSAQGAWPAIWMMPEDGSAGWPGCGEIDLMEHLNYESIVYQTLHSNYTYDVSKENPLSHITYPIDRSVYNTYAVEMGKDNLKLSVNGNVNMSYPNLGIAGQFPFDKEFYLILDMQLGGSWVGNVTGSGLPVEMLIDWVKFYKRVEKGGKLSVFSGVTPIKSGDTVIEGSEITVNAIPVENYEVDKIIVNDADVTSEYLKTNSYSFTADAKTEISATYKLKSYTVNYDIQGYGTLTVTNGNGEVINNGSAIEHGDSIKLSFAPGKGESILEYNFNGEDRIGKIVDNTDAIVATSNASINVRFSDLSGLKEDTEFGCKVYSKAGKLTICTNTEEKADIFTTTGVLLSSVFVSGTKDIMLPSGIYIVTINGKEFKVAVK